MFPSHKLHAQGLCKFYGNVAALHPVELKVRSGELLTLLGPSGSGKTTLLQLIAGLTRPSDGRLLIDDRDQTDTDPYKRDIGVVFQNYALFPHLTVLGNVLFPLEMRKMRHDEASSRAAAALEIVGLSAYAKRFPGELSGGQQQRVALARCLVYRPSLILMDESLSALDRKLRDAMQVEIKRIHREIGATIIFVTHDQEEALALSDRICLMNEGQIVQLGTPNELYDRPNSVFTAGFIGISNIFCARIEDGGATIGGITDRRDAIDPAMFGAARVGETVDVAVRPEHVRFVERGGRAGRRCRRGGDLCRLRGAGPRPAARRQGLHRPRSGKRCPPWARGGGFAVVGSGRSASPDDRPAAGQSTLVDMKSNSTGKVILR